MKKAIKADYSTLSEKNEMNPKIPKIKVNDRVRITKCKNIFSKGQEKYVWSILFWKLILGLIKIKIETERKW